MQKFGNIILAQRRNAAFFAALFALLPFFGAVSAAIVCLVSLRQGAKEGLIVLLWSLLPTVVVSMLNGYSPILWAMILLANVPMYVFALVLRYTVSWQKIFYTAVLFGLVCLALIHISVPEVALWWFGKYQQVQQILTQENPSLAVELMQHVTTDGLLKLSKFMTGILISLNLLSAIMIVLLSRAWQSILFNPGGFSQEFYRISMPIPLTIIFLVGLVLAQFDYDFLKDAMVLLAVPLITASISLAHCFFQGKNKPMVWAIVFYGVLVLMPYLFIIVMGLSLLDSGLDIRKRWLNKKDQVKSMN